MRRRNRSDDGRSSIQGRDVIKFPVMPGCNKLWHPSSFRWDSRWENWTTLLIGDDRAVLLLLVDHSADLQPGCLRTAKLQETSLIT